MTRHCRRVLLSCQAMKKEFDRFYSSASSKSVALPFAVPPPDESEIPPLEALRKTYDLPERFFYVPNQFWAHKNHELIIRALEILVKRGESVFVVSTGSTYDYRKRSYFQEIKALLDTSPAQSHFRVLGNVPRSDVLGLAKACVAMINPSFYEGWSTSVEEAKSMGKTILLSNIAVHKEQAPVRGLFFDPRNAEELAEVLLKTWTGYSVEGEAQWVASARADAIRRLRSYAAAYQDIVERTLDHR